MCRRGNRRIQVFDGDGKFLRQITIDVPFDYANAAPAIGNKPGPNATGTMASGHPGQSALRLEPHQVLYAADAFPGRSTNLAWRGRSWVYSASPANNSKQFGWIHEIACPSENVVFVAELLNWRVQKLILHPKEIGAGSRLLKSRA